MRELEGPTRNNDYDRIGITEILPKNMEDCEIQHVETTYHVIAYI